MLSSTSGPAGTSLPKSSFVVLMVDPGGNGACAAKKSVGWATHDNRPEVGNSC